MILKQWINNTFTNCWACLKLMTDHSQLNKRNTRRNERRKLSIAFKVKRRMNLKRPQAFCKMFNNSSQLKVRDEFFLRTFNNPNYSRKNSCHVHLKFKFIEPFSTSHKQQSSNIYIDEILFQNLVRKPTFWRFIQCFMSWSIRKLMCRSFIIVDLQLRSTGPMIKFDKYQIKGFHLYVEKRKSFITWQFAM